MESNQVNSSIQLEIPEESCWTSGYWGSQVNIRESFKNVIFYSTPTECKNRRRKKKKNPGTGLELVGGGEGWAKVMGQIVETMGSVKLEMGSVVGCVECHRKLISSSLHFTPLGSWVWGLPGLEQWLSSNTQVWNSEFRPWTCTSLTTYWELSKLETGERETQHLHALAVLFLSTRTHDPALDNCFVCVGQLVSFPVFLKNYLTGRINKTSDSFTLPQTSSFPLRRRRDKKEK